MHRMLVSVVVVIACFPFLPSHIQVLTLEWVEGARLVDKEALVNYKANPEKLVDTLVQCSLRQMLEVGRCLGSGPLFPLLFLY